MRVVLIFSFTCWKAIKCTKMSIYSFKLHVYIKKPHFNRCYHTADSPTLYYWKEHNAPRVHRFVPTHLQLLLLTVHYRAELSCECLRLITVWRQRDFCESSNLSLPAVQSWPLRKASLENADGQHASSSCVSDVLSPRSCTHHFLHIWLFSLAFCFPSGVYLTA